jgi:hypothetical protein
MATREQILLWTEVLELYARDWDETFESRPSYFTQEFWYLLVGCMVNNWRGTPLTVSAASQYMKTGSNRTREERIKKAVVDGYLTKIKQGTDGREAMVVPTPKLEAIMQAHLERTLAMTTATLQQILVHAPAEN